MPKRKRQLFVIHGGMTFRSKKDYLNFLKSREISVERKTKWADEYLDKKLGKYFDIIRPRMPLSENAKYGEWKMNFERYFPYFKNGVMLIGNSLGGIFLAKYLSENGFPKKILSVYLVCPPFDGSLSEEDLVGGFRLRSDLSALEEKTKNLNLFFSKDDDVVPAEHAEKYRKKLKNARIFIYEGKNGHFKISEFPEIVKMIKEEAKIK